MFRAYGAGLRSNGVAKVVLKKQKEFLWKKAAAFATIGSVGALYAGSVALADDDVLHPPQYNWPNNGILSTYDHASMRRGLQVYQQICAACHSLELVAFRTLVGTMLTEEEAKAMASEIDYEDGPDDTGEMFERPGKLSDCFPSPYKNEEEGRMANAGAYPPDLSCMTKARHSGQDYVFSLLTGYRDAPEGVTLREGLYFNPYFPGGAIAMPKQLEDGAVEYEDGTPSTASQMAKDVTMFLSWASEPEHDERKRQGFKWCTALLLTAVVSGFYKRFRFSTLKARKIEYTK
mmetsp:Transcript_3676/g.5354  ORF Transcript_3676/g.5354 Transcript_3676/m.5354 type:complete len:290 (+) Transcript_3676:112-981(+)|eukprot:CAMPEP_0203746170 /NCGR_PEP_ID=MMETSP0098-20131031/1688_1 /ASSEMBLY_ACC=CAM_ASM_000208 /TAXON_ID=96639 /ORGANISM=" , Strain NY0313808BC1" /LENGTH=289 /DNA_ID=CAMNT_0050634161 /DNA_START=77 /DNA_END=946 /DNA_ORIENTATION=-